MLTALAEAVAQFKNNQGVIGKPLDTPLSSTEQIVLKAIVGNPYNTYQEIAEQIGKTAKTVQRTLASLRDRGLYPE